MTTNTQTPAGLKVSEQKALAALAEHSGATASEIAAHAGIGGSTTGKALTALESHNLAHRERGEKNSGRKTADRWYHRPVEAEPEEIAADETEAPASAEDAPVEAPEAPAEAVTPTEEAEPAPKAPTKKAAPGTRLARGGLRQMVYEYLEAHPGDEVTAPRLAKTLGRSAGAVANALVKLKDQGQADLIGESPRRYRLAVQA
ncbi:helix-turn-helix domain-containing protein [Streptomyces sp. NPDC050204]|uniref:helix-turn-helix domain-containing protein n=1 Tax=Streptomyces sp. NPDC050204 TaxID=3155514 RepID=UPI003441B54B